MRIITPWPGHTELLRATYRRLLRGVAKLSGKFPQLEEINGPVSFQLHRELTKAKTHPKQYVGYLVSELKYRIDEEFRKEHKTVNERSLYAMLSVSSQLIENCQNIEKGHNEPLSWRSLIKILVEHRENELERNQWKLSYQKNRQEINEKRDKDTDPLTVKRLQTIRSRNTPPEVKFSQLSATKRLKAIKEAILESKENAAFVVRNYLKKLQLQGKIPNPYKLPYAPESMTQNMINLPKENTLLPGSTKTHVINAAYDTEYIEAIIKPEVEWKINENDHLAKFKEIVEEKGPFPVKIRHTNAGIMKVNFFRLPFTRYTEMREIALDIKKLMRAIRKQFIWNLKPSKTNVPPEKKHGEGYSVRSSKGFSSAEIMYPRKYHENLVFWEADWEIQMERARMEEQGRFEEFVASGDYQEFAKATFADWNRPILESSRLIDEEVKSFYEKYKIAKNDPIWQDQKNIQMEMNEKFQDTLSRYTELLQKLEEDRVFMHSELYRSGTTKRSLEDQLISEENKNVKARFGVLEFAGDGKKLGDYLEEFGFKGYKLGYRFKRRLKVTRNDKNLHEEK